MLLVLICGIVGAIVLGAPFSGFGLGAVILFGAVGFIGGSAVGAILALLVRLAKATSGPSDRPPTGADWRPPPDRSYQGN
jgi:hypothetical protein